MNQALQQCRERLAYGMQDQSAIPGPSRVIPRQPNVALEPVQSESVLSSVDIIEPPELEGAETPSTPSVMSEPIMDDPDVALAIAESGSTDLFETFEQLVLYSEGYSNTHNKVRTFLHKYRLDRILSPSEIQSLPYADGKYRPTDESYKELNHQKCIRLLRMIPVDATNPQVAENAIRALLPEGTTSAMSIPDNAPENSGQSETSATPAQSNQSTGSTLSDLQPAESSTQSFNQDERDQEILEDGEEDEPPCNLWSLWLQIALTAGDLPTTRTALNTLVRTHGLQRILSKAEIQSIPYIGGRQVPANQEHALLNQRKAETLLNMIPYDENDPSVAKNAILNLLPNSERQRISKQEKAKPKPSTSCKPSQPVRRRSSSSDSSEPDSEDSEVRTEQLRKEWDSHAKPSGKQENQRDNLNQGSKPTTSNVSKPDTFDMTQVHQALNQAEISEAWRNLISDRTGRCSKINTVKQGIQSLTESSLKRTLGEAQSTIELNANQEIHWDLPEYLDKLKPEFTSIVNEQSQRLSSTVIQYLEKYSD